MAGLERWHKQRVQAARKRQQLVTASQVERSTIPVTVRRDDEVVDVDVPVPELVQEGVRAGEEADIARGEAAAALGGVSTALTAANNAAQKAAAATETALGFARYSQVDGGPIVPALPVDGPRVGAELVYVDVNGHPYQANVWNGTEWVKNQLLIDQLLSLSPEGTVQIENGRLVAPEVIGGLLEGAIVRGSTLELKSAASLGVLTTDTFETTNAWSGSTSTAQKHGGLRSLLVPTVGGRKDSIRANVTLPVGTSYVKLTFWVYSTVATAVEVTWAHGTTRSYRPETTSVAPAVWTQVEEYIQLTSGYGPVSFGLRGTVGVTGSLYVDDVAIEAMAGAPDGVRISRGSSGEATFDAFSGNGGYTRVDRRGFALVTDESKAVQVGYGDGSFHIEAFSNPLRIGASDLTVRAPTTFNKQVSFAGDTAWENATLAPGVTGTARWRRFGGNTFVEFSINSASVPADGLLNPAFTIPPSEVPAAGAPLVVNGGGTRPAIGRMSPANGGAIIRNTYTGPQSAGFIGGGSWLST